MCAFTPENGQESKKTDAAAHHPLLACAGTAGGNAGSGCHGKIS